MRYGYLVKKPNLESGLSVKENSHDYKYDYLKTIFRRLLVCDQTGEANGWQKAIHEAAETLSIENPAFVEAVSSEYLQFIKQESCHAKWQKIRQDNNFLISREQKRRNEENPYHNFHPNQIKDWNELPESGRAYKNKPWQFEKIYKDINYFCLKILEYIKGFPQTDDFDLARLKINSLLSADKIIYALDSASSKGEYLAGAATIIDVKISLDGFRLSEKFLDRVIETLHKIKWKKTEAFAEDNQVNAFIYFSMQISDSLRERIKEYERKLIMFMNMENED